MMPQANAFRLEASTLELLIQRIRKCGYTLIGPTARNGAIILDEIQTTAELPRGQSDEQEGGFYRLGPSDRPNYFHFNNGPQSWKSRLFAPRERLWRGHRGADGEVEFEAEPVPTQKLAFIGARSCDLHAIAIQDKTFIEGAYKDPRYLARKENTFIVAVNCSKAGKTCFCVSMGTGPKARSGFDLSLTEVSTPNEHYFVCEVGSGQGLDMIKTIPLVAASRTDTESASSVTQKTAQEMGRSLDTSRIKELLYENQEHPRWNEVAERCLSCANCTLVCPTCFCSTIEDVTDLTGDHTERWRRWDSCFNLDHSYLHGGSIHASTSSRYRQWLTHKVASWIDQYGVSGCVGCGRCITWCPVAIDITEEVAAIRASEGTKERSS